MELGPHGIRVNSIAPGVVDTALWEKNKAIPGVVEAIDAQTPLRRWSQPDDIADVVVFLASNAARFITGETISADGGMGEPFQETTTRTRARLGTWNSLACGSPSR